MKIIFAGTTDNAVDVLRYLAEKTPHEIVAVLTRLDAPVGRKRLMTSSPVALYADSKGIPVMRANNVNEAVDQELSLYGADLGLVVAYGSLLKRSTLNVPTHGWINIHYSLLPKLRGAAPVQRALIAGEEETGVSIFRLDEGMDTGSLYSQVATLIEPDENAKDLLSRLTNIAVSMIDECLAVIEAETLAPTPQIGEPTFAPKLSRTDAKIDFKKSAKAIESLVRGCNPEPMAWAELNGEPIRILRARALQVSINEDRVTGEVFMRGDRVLIQSASGELELMEVQPASKKVMGAADWMRGTKGVVVLK